MKFRKPCQHGQYDAHYVGDGLPIFGYSGDVPLQCLGGEFLADDAIIIERDAHRTWPAWAIRALDTLAPEWAVSALDALASAQDQR